MPLRVTFLVNEINLKTGGGSHHTFELTTRGLRDLGFDIRVIALNGASARDGAELPGRVTVETGWQRSTRYGRIRAVADILRRHERDTDLFHIFSPGWAPAGGLYRADGPVPTVATLNSYSLWCTNMDQMDGRCQRHCTIVQRTMHAPMPPLRKALSVPARVLEHRAFSWVQHIDHFMPNSPGTKRVYEEAGFNLARSTMIPALIDFAALRAASQRPWLDRAARHGPKHVLYAGRLASTKGVDLLLDALPHLAHRVEVHIAGDGPERASLEARASALGVSDQVTFHGWVPNRRLWDMLQRVDIFVHPGRWPEPCGRSVQEAMALGIPTIASDLGGPPWLLGRHGWTFRPGDAADLARQLDTLTASYDDALLTAADGIERAAEFDYPRWAPQLARIYETVSASSPSPLAAAAR
ncbi:MAG: glycosyltransferase family 4 protein [Chloroflexota bacterium]